MPWPVVLPRVVRLLRIMLVLFVERGVQGVAQHVGGSHIDWQITVIVARISACASL